MEKIITFIVISIIVSPALNAIVLLNNTPNTSVSFVFSINYKEIRRGTVNKHTLKKTSPLIEAGTKKQIQLLDDKEKLQHLESFNIEAMWGANSVRCKINEFPNDIDHARVLFSYDKEHKKHTCSITRIKAKANL